ncbi:MAG: MBL fold metallo-hydrolase [Syntrophorhabdales bacterium]|jgi:glyoxylase-like metal-dependent hydrolase (beta-lactamase superfamily II)
MGAHVIVKQMEVGRMAVYAYLVGCEKTKEALVIDPAGDEDRILREANKKGLKIKYIVNTHSHVDHILGNKRMQDLTNATIVIHEKEAYALTHQSQQMLNMFGAKASPPAGKTVKEGDVITVGEVSLSVIHTPGHSPGAICLYGHGLVFTGDTLFVGGVGRTDLGGGSHEVLASSIRNKLFTLPDSTVVLPGHNYGSAPKSTIGTEKVNNPYVGSRS